MARKVPWQTSYMLLVIVAALLVLGLNWREFWPIEPLSFLAFLALAVAAEAQAVELPNGAWVVYGMVVALPASAILNPILGAVLGALGALIVRAVRMVRGTRSRSLLVAAFSTSQYFLCYYLAGAFYRQLLPPRPGFWEIVGAYLLALLVFKAANALLVDQAYNRFRGLYSRERFLTTLASEAAIHLFTAPPGLLMILTYPNFGLAGLVLSFCAVLPATVAIQRYVQGNRLAGMVQQRAEQLTHILEISETLRTDLELDLLLSRIVQAVQESLGFRVVLLSLYDPAEEVFVRRAAAGIPARDFAQLQAQRVPREAIGRFLDERFRLGHCYLVGHQVNPHCPDYSYVPQTPPGTGRDAWHPRDLLLVPMAGRQGELIGVISVDDPLDGRRPQPASLYALEIFAHQAAQAIENTRLYGELRQRLLSLEEANERIRQAQEELSRYSRTLEEMVARRTAELQERTGQLEAALARATEADRLKGEFLANMSHELRTPLNSIIGFSRVILNGIDGPITEVQRTDLTAIHNSGVHLLGLINDILDLSKIEAGRMELRPEAVDLGPVVRGVLGTCSPLVRDKPVELVERLPADLPPVYADPTRVRQVILNLVSNAIKYTDRGQVTVMARAQGREVVLSVHDTGVGINPQDLDKAFEAFGQVGRAPEREASGTGLGLTISKRFVEMHGGRIWAESEPGEGSTFFFTLPAMLSSRASVAGAPEGRTVLVVEDDPEIISLFRRYLEGEGYQVVGAGDAVEALRLAWELHPSAITLDIFLPDESAWNVLRALKEDRAIRETPVILCSVRQDEDTGFSLGAADYLSRPIAQEDLLAALSRLHRPVHRIVVIDDQPADLGALILMLQGSGRYMAIPAGSGEEGLRAIQEHRPDLVILDLMRPGLDGGELLARLKADRRTRTIPIIVVTARDLGPEDEARLRDQMAELLHKGLFRTEDLLADVARVLRERGVHV